MARELCSSRRPLCRRDRHNPVTLDSARTAGLHPMTGSVTPELIEAGVRSAGAAAAPARPAPLSPPRLSEGARKEPQPCCSTAGPRSSPAPPRPGASARRRRSSSPSTAVGSRSSIWQRPTRRRPPRTLDGARRLRLRRPGQGQLQGDGKTDHRRLRRRGRAHQQCRAVAPNRIMEISPADYDEADGRQPARHALHVAGADPAFSRSSLRSDRVPGLGRGAAGRRPLRRAALRCLEGRGPGAGQGDGAPSSRPTASA